VIIIKTKRTFNTINDNLTRDEDCIPITSGSFGEGLEMKGSDIDMMYDMSRVRVYEDINKVRFNSTETSFVMDMDDCRLGFTQLRLVQCNHAYILKCCKQIGDSSYFSNELLKTNIMPEAQATGEFHVHGPCVSSKDDTLDCAVCFHSTQWISPAHKWVRRPNTSSVEVG
jgi:hypothetical protein